MGDIRLNSLHIKNSKRISSISVEISEIGLLLQRVNLYFKEPTS